MREEAENKEILGKAKNTSSSFSKKLLQNSQNKLSFNFLFFVVISISLNKALRYKRFSLNEGLCYLSCVLNKQYYDWNIYFGILLSVRIEARPVWPKESLKSVISFWGKQYSSCSIHWKYFHNPIAKFLRIANMFEFRSCDPKDS